jgi:beta-fructofuranosidase
MRLITFALLLSLFACSPQPQSFYSDEFYIWDNWILKDGANLHRYYLAASKEFTPDERHENAYIRHAVSRDEGKTWKDLGAVLEPNADGDWPNLVVWSGSAIKYRDEILLFVTGRSKEDGLLQRIGLARSKDGHNFSDIKLILSPEEKFNYDISDEDGVIMAWRDPFVFLDPESDSYHMLFAAKEKNGDIIKASIGHAIALDESLENWKLLEALDLSESFPQIEVPSLIYKDGDYYLFVSTQNHPLEKTNLKKEAEFKYYKSNSLTGAWILEANLAKSDLYAATVFELTPGEYYATAFWSEHMPKPISATPIFKLQI